MSTASLLVVGGVAALVVVGVVALCVVHVQRARRQSTRSLGLRYAPHSAQPHGRWQVSRHGDELLEPAAYRLNTDHDGPTWQIPESPLRPVDPHAAAPTPQSLNRATDP